MQVRSLFPSAIALWLVVSACSSERGSAVAAADVVVPEPPGSGTDAAVTTAPPCEDEPLVLLAAETDGRLSRLFVEAMHEGNRVALLFDTGSAASFLERPLRTPDPAPHVADLAIGTCRVPVDGRPYPSDESIGGLDVVGTLGADVLLGAPASELDLGTKKIVRRVALPLPADVKAWPTVPLEIVLGHLLVHVTVDGKPLRLMVDTGSAHLLLIGKGAKPGDQEVQTTDAAGNPLTLYLGIADISLAEGISPRVPILRAPKFPYFEETARALGGNVDGLLGLSALERRRIVIDREASVLRVRP